MRLRTVMVIIAVLAVVLGVGLSLHRRSARLSAAALAYGREANRIEDRLEREADSLRSDEVRPILDRVHWNDAVAGAYRTAASRPWALKEPDPGKITCRCGYHSKLAPARPGP